MLALPLINYDFWQNISLFIFSLVLSGDKKIYFMSYCENEMRKMHIPLRVSHM